MSAAPSVGIVTVSAIPSLTGTSVNPLLRAAHLGRLGWRTTLYLPWFAADRQQREYGRTFPSQAAQVELIRDWLPEALRPHLPAIRFYPAAADPYWQVPLPGEPLGRHLGAHDALILEEIERHFLAGGRIDPAVLGFRHRFRLVVGLIHTNTAAFVRAHAGAWTAPALRAISMLARRSACHHSFSVASAAGCLRAAGESMVALNGVADAYFESAAPRDATAGAYFIGKLIPEKEIHEAFRLIGLAGGRGIDLFGSGDRPYLEPAAAAHGVVPVLRGGAARPWLALAGYRVLVNCSHSEVACTATAEALAMGKWAIVPRHPSNRLFATFAGCLTYGDDGEFVACWRRAQAEAPPRDPTVARRLSWSAATARLHRLLTAPPARSHHDPAPYHPIPGRAQRGIRQWRERLAPGGHGASTGSLADPGADPHPG